MPCQSVRKTTAAPSHLHGAGGSPRERGLGWGGSVGHAPVHPQRPLKGHAEDVQHERPARDGQEEEAEGDGERVADAAVHAPALAVGEELVRKPQRRRRAARRDAREAAEEAERVAPPARRQVRRRPLPEVHPDRRRGARGRRRSCWGCVCGLLWLGRASAARGGRGDARPQPAARCVRDRAAHGGGGRRRRRVTRTLQGETRSGALTFACRTAGRGPRTGRRCRRRRSQPTGSLQRRGPASTPMGGREEGLLNLAEAPKRCCTILPPQTHRHVRPLHAPRRVDAARRQYACAAGGSPVRRGSAEGGDGGRIRGGSPGCEGDWR